MIKCRGMKKFLKWLLSLFTKEVTYEKPIAYGTMITVNSNVKSTKYDYSDIVKVVLEKELGINNILLNIIDSPTMLDKLSPEGIEYQAILVKIGLHAYSLYVKRSTFSPTILCHEMKHLDQYESNKLQLLPSKGYKWLGKEYPADYPYDIRPWEKEAFIAQTKLWKGYKTFKKNQKNENSKTRV